MTPKLYKMLDPLMKIKLNRLQRVMEEGSPKYHHDVAALAAAAFEDVHIATAFPRAVAYQPLDSCLVINNDVVDISLQFNSASEALYIIPAGVIRRISREEIAAIWSFRITNLDAVNAVTVNMIDIEIWRSPEDADSIARAGL